MNRTVAITAVVEDGESGELLIRNTGRANLYLAGFSLEDRHWVFPRPILVAASSGGDPGYLIRAGREFLEPLRAEGSTTLVLFLKDELQNRWISEIGFFKADDKGGARLRSYETSRESWELVLPENHVTSDDMSEHIEGARFTREARHGP
jgi:hypothetical protein